MCEALRAAGARAVWLPTLQVEPVRSSPALDAALSSVPVADWAIFASPNAVNYGLRLLAERGLRLPHWVRLATVGAGTAKVLRDHGYVVTCKPSSGFTSEALLDMPEFAVGPGERVLIFRGEGGRALLGETLRQRGAKVKFVEVYRRARPPVDAAAALAAWGQASRRWVIVTSEEGLGNLVQMVGPSVHELQEAGLITVSERIAQSAQRRGWRGPVRIAAEPGNSGLFSALVDAVNQ